MLGAERVSVMDVPEPEPSGPLVVVKIMASTICGSEMHSYRGPKAHDSNGGHEAVGIVWKTDEARYVKEGDRVSLFAQSSCGRCTHCLAGNWVLFPIDKAQEAFTTFAAGEAVKVMLLPWE
jgi:threonine dehydrogenase-like Zn-dependent dehydrogenase